MKIAIKEIEDGMEVETEGEAVMPVEVFSKFINLWKLCSMKTWVSPESNSRDEMYA